MKKILIFSSLVVVSLFAEMNKTKLFQEKYLSNLENMKSQIDVDTLAKKSKDVDLQKFRKLLDTNKTKIEKKYGVVFKKSNYEVAAKKEASNIYNITKTNKFHNEIKQSEDYILFDKQGFNYQKYLGKYQNIAKNVIKASDGKGYISQNRFLNKDEKLYMIISSSMPTQTIKNYFKEIQPVNTDITFVMRGTIGGIHKIKPTLKWLNNIVVIDSNKNPQDKKNRYQINLEINPKVTRRYNIQRVPALIYIQNFNPIIEMQQPMPKDDDNKEKVYIAYGDSNIEHSLQKINQKAKSKGIKRFLKSMKQGFFYK